MSLPARDAVRIAALAALAVAAAPAGAQPALWATDASAGGLYETGFEEFALGSIADQHGWVGINGRFTIETTRPHAGVQHFRGTSSGLAWSFARSPFITGTADLTIARAWMNLGTSSPAAIWEFTPGIANQGGITTVRFNADRSIDVLVSSPIPEGVFIPTGSTAPTDYFQLEVRVERATGQFEVLLDGVSIAQEQGLLQGGIEAVIIYSDMEDGTAGHTLDMDDLVLSDGPLVAGEESPAGAVLSNVVPSPFSDRAQLDLRVAESQRVTAVLHDALGRRLMVLFDGMLSAGVTRSLTIDGAGLPAGLYLVRISGTTFVSTRTVVRAE